MQIQASFLVGGGQWVAPASDLCLKTAGIIKWERLIIIP